MVNLPKENGKESIGNGRARSGQYRRGERRDNPPNAVNRSPLVAFVRPLLNPSSARSNQNQGSSSQGSSQSPFFRPWENHSSSRSNQSQSASQPVQRQAPPHPPQRSTPEQGSRSSDSSDPKECPGKDKTLSDD